MPLLVLLRLGGVTYLPGVQGVDLAHVRAPVLLLIAQRPRLSDDARERDEHGKGGEHYYCYSGVPRRYL